MTQFKVGDKIKVKEKCSGCYPGQIYTIDNNYSALDEDGNGGCSCQHNWILIQLDIKKLNEECFKFDKEEIISKPTITNRNEVNTDNEYEDEEDEFPF